MATGILNIVNSALLLAGCDTITSLTQENTRNARVANTIYDQIRQGMLRSHPWNFATKRASLALLTETPAFGYSYYYQLPADCLRIVREENPNVIYKVEGRRILTDQPGINIIYIYDVEDVSAMDRLFIEALTYRLAAQFAAMIKLDPGLGGAMDSKAEICERKARQVDGQEETAEMLISNLWTDGENGPI
jgi:hypothetical protein